MISERSTIFTTNYVTLIVVKWKQASDLRENYPTIMVLNVHVKLSFLGGKRSGWLNELGIWIT
jgi:hypothetical protein